MINNDLGYKLYNAVFKGKPDYLVNRHRFCSLGQLKKYRDTGVFEIENKPLFEEEEHIGIRLNYGDDMRVKQTEEGLFYLTPYIRFHPESRLYFHIKNNSNHLENITGYLGSERRGVSIEKEITEFDFSMKDSFYEKILADKKFKLILLQPGVFDSGWLPFLDNGVINDEQILEYKNMKFKLIFSRTTAINKISGMSFIEQKNASTKHYGLKSMINAVPAGSVYYFEIIDPQPEHKAILKELDSHKIPTTGSPYSKMGFNQVVLGRINNSTI